MHIHQAYTHVISWLETPGGKDALVYSLVSTRKGVDKGQATDKAEQILRDLRAGVLYLRDLRLLAACVVDNLLNLMLFLDSPDAGADTRNALVNEAGGWAKVPHHTLMWDPDAQARAKQSNPARATA